MPSQSIMKATMKFFLTIFLLTLCDSDWNQINSIHQDRIAILAPSNTKSQKGIVQSHQLIWVYLLLLRVFWWKVMRLQRIFIMTALTICRKLAIQLSSIPSQACVWSDIHYKCLLGLLDGIHPSYNQQRPPAPRPPPLHDQHQLHQRVFCTGTYSL